MAGIATENPYDLLGNDEDADAPPKAPVKTVDKPVTSTVKRNQAGDAVSRAAARAPASAGPRTPKDSVDGFNRNSNYDRPPREFSGRGRGDRGDRGGGRRGGGRGGRALGDRHARNNLKDDTEKSVGQAWGANDGDAEKRDEDAGDESAKKEQEADAAEAAAAAEGDEEEIAPEEPEEVQISFSDYQAQLKMKSMSLNEDLSQAPRLANDGKADVFNNATEFKREQEEELFAPTNLKEKRVKERKVKKIVEIDQSFQSPPSRGGGPRGGFRGGDRRGDRGDFRSDRSEFRSRGEDGGYRGRGRGGPRGDFRGARGDFRSDFRGGARGDFRGGRGRGDQPSGQSGASGGFNPDDTSAFPALGGS